MLALSRKMMVPAILLTLLAPLVTAAEAQSTVLVDTFGPGNLYDSNNYGVTGADTVYGLDNVANTFSIIGTDHTLDDIVTPIYYEMGPNAFSLSVETSDATGLPSGTALETFNLPAMANLPDGSAPPLLDIHSVLHPVLSHGVKYWLVVKAGTSQSFVGWAEAPHGPSGQPFGPVAFDQGNGWYTANSPIDAYRISGSPYPAAVPEASTTVAFGLLLALGGVVIAAKRKKASAA